MRTKAHRLFVAVTLLVSLTASCTAHPRQPPPTQIPPASESRFAHTGSIFAMLADNELIAATIDRGVVATRRLGPRASPVAVSHAMAISQDHTLVYVLVPRGASQPADSDRVDVITIGVPVLARCDELVFDTNTNARLGSSPGGKTTC